MRNAATWLGCDYVITISATLNIYLQIFTLLYLAVSGLLNECVGFISYAHNNNGSAK
ncbi:hypothetical protein [Ehrlichia canis]|uniref:hypothetical protein n=1 Tax=Ehrlichia canis TaxID=944 RepID=UPI0018C8B2AF|nr:hypothetical protein [Ehrlichia canis]